MVVNPGVCFGGLEVRLESRSTSQAGGGITQWPQIDGSVDNVEHKQRQSLAYQYTFVRPQILHRHHPLGCRLRRTYQSAPTDENKAANLGLDSNVSQH